MSSATRDAINIAGGNNAPDAIDYASIAFADTVRGSLKKAVEILNSALADDKITATLLSDAKSELSAALERAWKSGVTSLLLRDERSEFHDDLYWKSLYRPELHRLSSAMKLAESAKAGNEHELAAVAEAKRVLALFKPAHDAITYLKGRVVKRVVKSAEEKRTEKLVPKTEKSADVLAAVNAVIEQRRPELAERFIAQQRKVLTYLTGKYGVGLCRRLEADDRGRYAFISGSLQDSKHAMGMDDELKRLRRMIEDVSALHRIAIAKQIADLTAIINTPRAFDEAKLQEAANRFVDDTFDAVRFKCMEKAGELSNPVVKKMSGADFELTGEVHGKAVTIRQQIIVNTSVNGNLFNQFPARITVDGKATSEADYKTFMLSGGE